MIGLIIFIVAGFLILHILICWVVVTEEILDYGYYDKCYGCYSGFCMEEPGSKECLQIRKKLHIDKEDPGE